jgi:hypothetical protein
MPYKYVQKTRNYTNPHSKLHHPNVHCKTYLSIKNSETPLQQLHFYISTTKNQGAFNYLPLLRVGDLVQHKIANQTPHLSCARVIHNPKLEQQISETPLQQPKQPFGHHIPELIQTL